MKWSNHAETRAPGQLGRWDVAEGYIAQAARIMAGEAKLGETPDERRATIAKAQRVLRAVSRRAKPVSGPDHGLIALRHWAGRGT